MVGTPYLLFECPNQIWGEGHEGYRRILTDFGPSKLAIAEFRTIYEDNDLGVRSAMEAIGQLEAGDTSDYLGATQTPEYAVAMRERFYEKWK